MSFLSKRTPLYKTKREESPTRALHSSLNWENFKCELHPQLQIQALHHNKRNNTFSLVCVKCIIEGDYFTDGEDESITVKDLLDTVEEKIRARRNTMYDSPENMQEKFVNFLLKDYIGTYEKYLESQASQIDNAIEETIEKLTKVREKYRQYYSKQLAYVRDQGTDIKDEINKQLENEGGQTSSNFTSMNEIYKKIEKIENSEDLLDFFSELYKKTKEQGSDTKVTDSSYSSSRLVERMESFKDKAVSARGKDVDITRFENMQETIQNLLKTDSQAFKNSVERPERAERSERMERSEKVERGERTERTERSSKGKKMEYETPRSRLFESFPLKSRLLDSRSQSDVYNPSPARSVSSESEEESYVKAPKRRQPDPVRRPRKPNGAGGSHDIASHSLRNLKKELEKYEDQEDPLSPDSKKEKIMTSLSDWINRRITGYLVFQNTMNSDPDAEKEGGISETGVHLNQAMGKRWKSLSEEEREEFKALAKEFRKDFKQDLEENEDFEDTDALIEGLDERIKKLKRE